MNTNLMAVLTLAVILAFVGVLLAFVQHITRTLQHTGTILVSGKAIAGNIRRDCESIVSGVLALNKNLGIAAGGLTTVAETATRAATRAQQAAASQAAAARAAEAAAREAAAREAAAREAAARQAAAPAAPAAPAPAAPAAAAPAAPAARPAAEPKKFVWPYPPPARA